LFALFVGVTPVSTWMKFVPSMEYSRSNWVRPEMSSFHSAKASMSLAEPSA